MTCRYYKQLFCYWIVVCVSFSVANFSVANEVDNSSFLSQHNFTQSDAVLVTDESGNRVFEWGADRLLVPASLMKLLTAHLAIEKWGLAHRFVTEFYLHESQLWVKGFGDPYLVSEELDIIATELAKLLPKTINSIRIDSSYFSQLSAPGRSRVSDPYNAPQSAVAANFNTVMVKHLAGRLASAEAQTPLTEVAQQVASRAKISQKPTRLNLENASLAQRHFAQLLIAKLKLSSQLQIEIDQALPLDAKLLYRHQNTRTMADVLRGTLEFSNNFISNQLFLLFGDKQIEQMKFSDSSAIAERQLKQQFFWSDASVVDGAGLSRQNRLTAAQVGTLLGELAPYKDLLKEYSVKSLPQASVRAKTGTLNGVHNFAGYINLPKQQYQFVFIFNRPMPYRYRQTLLSDLVRQLAKPTD